MRRAGRVRAWVQLACLCLLCSSANVAHAIDPDDIRARLRVEPGATCLTAQRLAVEIEPLLDDVQLPSDLLFVVHGSASDPRSVRLRVVRGDRTAAERAFEPGPERCDRLHAAVGLAIALAINASQEPEGDEARVWSASAAGLWTYRAVPQFAPGLELLVRRDLGEHVRLRAGAVGVAAFGVALAPRAGTFDAAAVAARADGCARTSFSAAVRAGACLGFVGGMLYVAGEDVSGATSAVVPWLAASGAVDLEFVLSPRWSLAFGLAVNVLLHRVEVGVETPSGMRLESQSLDRASFALGIGPVYYF